MTKITATLTAVGETSPSIQVPPQYSASLSITGTFSATVELQRRFADETVWRSVKQYSAPIEELLYSAEFTVFRMVCVSFSSGAVSIRLSYE